MSKLNILFILLLLPSMFLLNACQTNYKSWNYKSSGQVAKQEPSQLSKSPIFVSSEELDTNTQTTDGGIVQETLKPSTDQADALNAILSQPVKQQLPTVKVALLLPLSGEHARLGNAMLNAAQMALFDAGHATFELLPRDTKGTPLGASAAAQMALQDGAQLILGPVFAPSVRAVKNIASRANVNMIAFSTDWTLSSSNTFVMGFLPFDQIERVITYAASQGYNTMGVLAPNTSYGNAVVSAYQTFAPRNGVETIDISLFAPTSPNLSPALRTFTQYDERVELLNQQIRPLETHINSFPNDETAKAELKALQDIDNIGAEPFNAVLLPVGGDLARATSNLLSHYDISPRIVKRLGTGLWDDKGLATEPSLAGSWFAGPSPRSRRDFEKRYKSTYQKSVPRLASLAYDATALSAILARNGIKTNGTPAFDRRSISNPNGFAGIDGIFRFRSDGMVERGLAILEYKNGEIVIIDDAPRTFQ